MSSDTGQSTDAAADNDDHDNDHTPGGQHRDLLLTDHAIQRWTERICSEHLGVAPWDLRNAFREAVSVNIDTDHARLHPPSQALIIFDYYWDRGPPVLITVFPAGWRDLSDSPLTICEDCDLRYDPGDGPCPWCPDG